MKIEINFDWPWAKKKQDEQKSQLEFRWEEGGAGTILVCETTGRVVGAVEQESAVIENGHTAILFGHGPIGLFVNEPAAQRALEKVVGAVSVVPSKAPRAMTRVVSLAQLAKGPLQ